MYLFYGYLDWFSARGSGSRKPAGPQEEELLQAVWASRPEAAAPCCACHMGDMWRHDEYYCTYIGANLVSLRKFRKVYKLPLYRPAPLCRAAFFFLEFSACFVQVSIDANDIRAILKDQGIGYWKQAWNALLVRLIIWMILMWFPLRKDMLRMFKVWMMVNRLIIYELGIAGIWGWSHEAFESFNGSIAPPESSFTTCVGQGSTQPNPWLDPGMAWVAPFLLEPPRPGNQAFHERLLADREGHKGTASASSLFRRVTY